MPRPVLLVVALILGAGSLASFAMGVLNAPEHSGRFPGQRPAAGAGAAAAIEAAEATPLSQERIEGPPPKIADKAANAEEPAAEEALDAPAPPVETAKPAPAANVQPQVQAPATGANAAAPPAEDEPPH